MKDVELAYLAAIIDGEGYIGILRQKPHNNGKNILHKAKIKIFNTDPRLLIWIKERIKFGSIFMTNRQGKWRNLFCYSLSDQKAADLLQEIYSFLVIKKEQADLIFRLRETYKKRYIELPIDILEERNKCYDELKKLHHKQFDEYINIGERKTNRGRKRK